MNRHKLADVLIVGRGGGSMEDLGPLTMSGVVRAIAASQILWFPQWAEGDLPSVTLPRTLGAHPVCSSRAGGAGTHRGPEKLQNLTRRLERQVTSALDQWETDFCGLPSPGCCAIRRDC